MLSFFLLPLQAKMATAFFSSMPMIVCAVMAVMLFLEHQRRHDGLLRWLIVWAIASTLLYVGHFVFFQHVISLIPASDTVYVAMNLLVYPLYLIYISELTDRTPLTSRPLMMGLLLAPGIVAGILCGMFYVLMDAQETHAFIHDYLYQNDASKLHDTALLQVWVHKCRYILFALQVIGVAMAGIRKVHHYNYVVSTLYADTEDKEVRGMKTILILLSVTVILSFTLNGIGRTWFNSPLRLALPAIAFSAILFAIGWTGMKQRFSARDIVRQHKSKPATPSKVVNVAQICAKLERYIDNDQTFLKQDLRLEQVAKRIGTNRTYLLQAMNDGMHMTFKEYINRKRIAYAEELLKKRPTLSKAELAILSGYNSMSSFYRNSKLYSTELNVKKDPRA